MGKTNGKNGRIRELIISKLLKNDLYVELFSSAGKKLFFNKYTSIQNFKTIPFEFTSLPSGVYFLKIMDKDNTKLLKFVRRRLF